jgi:hypothetical protein
MTSLGIHWLKRAAGDKEGLMATCMAPSLSRERAGVRGTAGGVALTPTLSRRERERKKTEEGVREW